MSHTAIDKAIIKHCEEIKRLVNNKFSILSDQYDADLDDLADAITQKGLTVRDVFKLISIIKVTPPMS